MTDKHQRKKGGETASHKSIDTIPSLDETVPDGSVSEQQQEWLQALALSESVAGLPHCFRTLLLSKTPFSASEALVSVFLRNMSELLQQDTVKRSVQQIECPGGIGDFLDRRDSRLNSPDHNCWTEYQQRSSSVRHRNVKANCQEVLDAQRQCQPSDNQENGQQSCANLRADLHHQPYGKPCRSRELAICRQTGICAFRSFAVYNAWLSRVVFPVPVQSRS